MPLHDPDKRIDRPQFQEPEFEISEIGSNLRFALANAGVVDLKHFKANVDDLIRGFGLAKSVAFECHVPEDKATFEMHVTTSSKRGEKRLHALIFVYEGEKNKGAVTFMPERSCLGVAKISFEVSQALLSRAKEIAATCPEEKKV